MSDRQAPAYPEAMSRRLLPEAVIVAAVAIAIGLTLPFGRPWVDTLFVAVIVAAAAMGARVVLRTVRAASAERRDAAALANAPATTLVAAALDDERARLVDDIDVALRSSLERMMRLSDPECVADGDERGGRRRRARRGDRVSPHRRMGSGPARRRADGHRRGIRRRLAPGAGDGCARLRRRLPGGRGAGDLRRQRLLDDPVVGLLLGRLCAVGSTWRDAIGAAALFAAIPIATLQTDPDNTGITVAIAVAGVVGGLIVRVARAAGRAARSRAAARRGEVQPLVDDAIAAERATVARELHDTVSHAIGVIAMQAAAGEVSWQDHPERTRDSIRLIHDTARTALAELDAGLRVPAARPRDLEGLVARIRATGTDVRVEGSTAPPIGLDAIAYRIVQEAMTNALRHAPGSPVRIEIDVRDGMLVLAVEDEGTRSGGEVARGYGLTGVAERVALAGGRLTVGTGPGGRGFRLEAAIPEPQGMPA